MVGGLIERVRDETAGLIPDDRGFAEGVEDKRLLVHGPEFAAVLSRMSRDGSTVAPALGSASDGTPLSMLNRGSNGLRARTHHVTVVEHVAPARQECAAGHQAIS